MASEILLSELVSREDLKRGEENRMKFDSWILDLAKMKAEAIFVFSLRPDKQPHFIVDVPEGTTPEEIISLFEQALRMMKQKAPVTSAKN